MATDATAVSDACEAIVHVDNASPSWLEPVAIATPKDGALFRVARTSRACVDAASLHYFWYYDWDASQPTVDTAAVCQDSQDCTLVVCDRPHNTQAHHTVLMVVSDANLLPTATSPTEFPAGAAYDAIVWQLDVKGGCL